MTTITKEVRRLEKLYQQLGYPMKRQPPATDERIKELISRIGVQIDDALVSLWRYSNGSNGRFWFATPGFDELEFTPYAFQSVEESLKDWAMFLPYNEDTYRTWYDDEEWGERDTRIQRHFLRHRLWVPFAEFNGGSHQLLFDADPTADGTFGQIINYIHDPDGIFWSARSFIEFLATSNDALESALTIDKEVTAEHLWLHFGEPDSE
jgi:cell wall assembly regulator SMI1